jgi:hypothetical protein
LGGHEWDVGDYSDFSANDDRDRRDGGNCSDFSLNEGGSNEHLENGWGIDYETDEGGTTKDSQCPKETAVLGDCGCVTVQENEDENEDEDVL